MGATEIVLIVLGIIAFVLSFVIPAKKEKISKESLRDAKEEIKKIVDVAVKEANSNIEDNVKEISDYNIEKAERAMERLCNEKIMAINEYSSTVLESIDKNHQEVMFLYDMLNEKHNTIKEAVATVDKTAKEVKQTAQDVAVEMKEVREIKEEKQEEIQLISLDKFVPEIDETRAEIAINNVDAATEVEDTVSEDIVKQLDVIKSTKTKKTTSRKKTAKPKDVEAPDLNIGTLAAKKDGGRNSNERILQLHNAGKSNVAIAKELGLGIGEVKLVIDLFEGM
ncbi:MAG: helix-turn-helix domain-containing protein [Lachnospiraceae bacterium]|nr:helix-turn-helix domain-containing protein [Lachnospiraceae bacterium]